MTSEVEQAFTVLYWVVLLIALFFLFYTIFLGWSLWDDDDDDEEET